MQRSSLGDPTQARTHTFSGAQSHVLLQQVLLCRQLRFSEAFRAVNNSKGPLTNIANGRNATFCAQRSHLSSNPLKVFVRIRPAAVACVLGGGDEKMFVQAASDVELNMYPPNRDKRCASLTLCDAGVRVKC